MINISKREKLNFIRSVFGQVEINSDGINVAVICPLCKKKAGTQKKKLTIRVDDDRWHCWVCNAKGKDLVPLLKKVSPGAKLQEYVTRVLGGRILQQKVEKEAVAEVNPEQILPRDFILLATVADGSYYPARKALQYLFSRGIDKRDLWYFKFGISSYSMHKNRVIMPSFDDRGYTNYFASRTYDKNEVRRKYINAKASKTEIIFNELNLDWNISLTLVEGPFDLTKCNDNATCLLGSTLSAKSRLFEKIVKHKTPVTLVLDANENLKTKKIAGLLNRYGIDVSTVDISHYGSDPGSLTKKQFKECLKDKKPWNSLMGIGDLL